MTYEITATRIDTSGVRVSSNNAETLGDAYGVQYDTIEAARAALKGLEETKGDYGMSEAEYEIV